MSALTLLERIRSAELEHVIGWFEPGQHVLELGAGSGYQASLLARRGCDVTALDVGTRPSQERTHFPVRDYDGRSIPLPDSSVDVVFSSHVLEHVDPVEPLLAETRRVMNERALAVHIVPTSTWRIWTSLVHFPFMAKALLFGSKRESLVNITNVREATERHGVLGAVKKGLVHPFVAHGSRGNAVKEVQTFRKSTWTDTFSENGFEILEASPTKLFYTGYGLIPNMSVTKRQTLSRLFGSASHAFVLRKVQPSSRR